jgi:soluble lytic murein transglycosylase-like protein
MIGLALLAVLVLGIRVYITFSPRLLDWLDTWEAVPYARALWWIDFISMALLTLSALTHSAAGCAAGIAVPESSVAYRLRVERAAAEYFGVEASPARLAAQLHQESGWRPDARSKYAWGLAQFTPATAEWLPKACPDLADFDPWDASQSIRAAACYDRWLYDRVSGASDCDRWAFALSAYNGGLGWVHKDRQRASATGADAARWFGHTELTSSRATWARDENRNYVRRILLRIEPAYIAAGWSGAAACAQ